MQIVATEQAVADLASLHAAARERDPVAASRLGIQLMAALDRLEYQSQRGRPGQVAGTRELVEVGPYTIVYRVTAEAVQILRVCCA
jgi:plasmid stabilization system protein ParE